MTGSSWINGVDGDWSADGDWNNGVPSDTSADATIAAPGTYTVTINSEEGFNVNSVTLNDAHATLAVAGFLSLNSGFSITAGAITGAGSLDITGGTIGGGTVSVANQSISGAVTLSASLTDSGAVSLGSSVSDTLALGSNTLTLTGKNAILAGTLSGTGKLALVGGGQTLEGASLGMSKLSMSDGDSLMVNSSLTYAGTFTQAAGTHLTVAHGRQLIFTGTATLSGEVVGTVNVVGGNITLDTNGRNNTRGPAQLTQNGGTLAINRNLTYAGTLADTGGNIALNGKTLTITGALNLTGMAFTTAGTICMKGRSVTSGIAVNAGASVFNFGNQTDSGIITLGDATHASQFVNVAGATLTLTDGMQVAGSLGPAGSTAGSRSADAAKRSNPKSLLSNKGKLLVVNGRGRGGVSIRYPDLATTSTSIIGVAVQNSSTGTVSVQAGTLEIDGRFTNSNSKAGAISVSAGAALDLGGGGSSSAGAFKVATGGMLVFSDGIFSLAAGKIQGAISLTGGTLECGANAVTIAGAFMQSRGTLDGSGVVTLTGAATFAGTPGTPGLAGQTGAGKTILRGKTTVGIDFALDGGRVLENVGTLRWLGGNFELGRNPAGVSGGGATIRNDAGATITITCNRSISGYSGNMSLINAGTMIKSGSTGNTTIAVRFNNVGKVSVTEGTLELVEDVIGSGGVFTISGGSTLEADAALPKSQAVRFGAGGGKLVLNDTAEFGATVSGFGAGDGVDLTGFAFGGKPKASFVENAAKTQGVLTVTDGKQSLKMTLFGQYVAAGFHLTHDSGAGTAVTYAPPPGAHLDLAVGH
jgi:fibronectin-binding autotransporter adhesin